MPDATWTSPEDVRSRWLGSEDLPSSAVIQAWIDDAETLIFAEFPSLQERLTDDPDGTWRARLVYVTTQLTIQALRNPNGIRQRSQTAGDFTDSVTYGSETISGIMQLTPAHKALLNGAKPRHVGIDMTVDKTTPPLAGVWVNGPDGTEPRGRR
ncbi:hypothetical protein KRX51_03205 [Corynebacterium sp. TAE3-ERU12]|uniref:hypothetical protein n=1 Tax=Corynebacterium sp. TAE3-ERU12 TaxID=2849491 RepID=UPI001C45D3B4|nr:hypothetical protein [Corynebacterium sp. TAE3-ERU12]MBV7294926.1 hypothetical protein [Corynebacterium sp. TAE3-ERU12]